MKQNHSFSKVSRISLGVILFLVLALLPIMVYAKAGVPGPPPPGKAWVWVEPKWELVSAPPPGPHDWKAGYWDSRKGIWIDGSWTEIKGKKGRTWIAGHFDDKKGVWIGGHWGRPGKGGIVISIGAPAPKRVPAPPPPGQSWVWAPGRWELVAAAPEGPAEWKAGYWDAKLNVWVPGAWITIGTPAPAGRVWVPGHWDRARRAWVPPGWARGKPAPAPVVAPPPPGPKPVVAPPPPAPRPGPRPARPGTPLPPGQHWEWDPGIGKWVPRPN